MRGVAESIGLRVLAIDPTSKGLAYAVLEGKTRLIDYGGAEPRRGRSRAFRPKVARLLQLFKPDVVVVESPLKTTRRKRAKMRIRTIEREALRRGHPGCRVTRDEVKQALGWKGATKYHLALAATRAFPELLHRLPPERKLYNTEDGRMNVFDAVNFALTFFYNVEREETEPNGDE